MTQSQRKLIGTVLTIIGVMIYAAAATAIYDRWLVGAPNLLLLLYFLLAGLGWIFPAMAIIRWMSRPDPSR